MVGMDQYDSSHRCSSSIPAVAHAGVVLLGFPRAVFLYVVVRPRCSASGRYGPDGQVCSLRVWPRSSSNAAVAYLAGFAGDDFYALFPSVFVGRTGILGILVCMDQKVFSRFPVVHTSTVCNDRCHGLWGAENCGISAVAVHAGR